MDDMPEKPVSITDSDFDEIVGKYPLLLVDFWAPWCHPCRTIAPIIDSLAKEYKGKLVCAKLDIDENIKTTRRFQVNSIPTVILFKDGRPVDTIIGVVPKSYFESKLRPYLNVKNEIV